MTSNFRQHKIFFATISRAACGNELNFVVTPKCQNGANLSPILSFEIFIFFDFSVFTVILDINLKIIFGLVFVKILSSILKFINNFFQKIFLLKNIFDLTLS